MNLFGLIGYLFGATFSLVLAILRLILICIISGTALFKGYNPWIWGILTLLVPWPFPVLLTLLIFYLPKKLPKLPRSMRQEPAFKDKNPVIAAIMALGAMIAKADGNVSKEEVHCIKDFVKSHFGISQEEINDYAGAFDYGKDHPEDYLVFAELILGYYRTRRDYVSALAYLFVRLAVEDGEMTAAKDEQTRKIILALGLNDYHYEALKQAIKGSAQGYSGYYGGYQGTGGFGYEQPQENLEKKYTEVLGVREDASMAEIKKAYRKLVKEYHPDKLSAGSMPQEYIDFANQKIREINEAYEYLEKTRGNH